MTLDNFDYYAILDISPNSSIQNIKEAFRKKAKELHPDLSSNTRDNQKKMRLLLQAYRVLTSQANDDLYTRFYRDRAPKKQFNYRKFLQERVSDPKCSSKLIFYCLLHKQPEEATKLYNTYFRNRPVNIVDQMNRNDCMDCLFLLAKAYEKNRELLQAYRLFMIIADMEREKPYFRHFFQEVRSSLYTLVCYSMDNHVSLEIILSCVLEMINYDFSPEYTTCCYIKAVEISLLLHDYPMALRYLKLGAALNKNSSEIKRMLRHLQKKVA